MNKYIYDMINERDDNDLYKNDMIKKYICKYMCVYMIYISW